MKKFISFLFVLLMLLASFTTSAQQQYPRGDVNYDSDVDISDVTFLIDYLLTGIWPDGETFTVNGVTFTMVTVEGGTFTMGASSDDSDAHDDERPAHEVTLSSFSIGKTEVTQALWLAVMGSNPSLFTPDNGYSSDLNRPVECVSWYDCQTFITKLNEMTGKTFRLPTEAEWEFAARGGNKGNGYRYAGSNDIDEVAWYWNNIPSNTEGTEGYGTQPVGTKAPNELGLYDMTGNVWEWCQDWIGTYSSEPQTDPQGPETGIMRVGRGGGWNRSGGSTYSNSTNCRVSIRSHNNPELTCGHQGLRLVL